MKLALALLLSLACVHSAAADPAQTRVGYAYDKKGENLLYTEHHHEVRGEGLVSKSRVLYKKTSGEVFAEKDLDFSIDYFLPT